jgi:signal transduction histidine kinase
LRPFHRLDRSRSPATGGSGLGLAIVSQLCEAHGWALTLTDAPTGGLEVRVELPRSRARGPRSAAPAGDAQ